MVAFVKLHKKDEEIWINTRFIESISSVNREYEESKIHGLNSVINMNGWDDGCHYVMETPQEILAMIPQDAAIAERLDGLNGHLADITESIESLRANIQDK